MPDSSSRGHSDIGGKKSREVWHVADVTLMCRAHGSMWAIWSSVCYVTGLQWRRVRGGCGVYASGAEPSSSGRSLFSFLHNCGLNTKNLELLRFVFLVTHAYSPMLYESLKLKKSGIIPKCVYLTLNNQEVPRPWFDWQAFSPPRALQIRKKHTHIHDDETCSSHFVNANVIMWLCYRRRWDPLHDNRCDPMRASTSAAQQPPTLPADSLWPQVTQLLHSQSSTDWKPEGG